MTNRGHNTTEDEPHFVLDITNEVCPLTFVRTKLLIERMMPGQTAEVLLRGSEPLANVPRAVLGLGHQVLEVLPVVEEGGEEEQQRIHRLRFRKCDGKQAIKEHDA